MKEEDVSVNLYGYVLEHGRVMDIKEQDYVMSYREICEEVAKDYDDDYISGCVSRFRKEFKKLDDDSVDVARFRRGFVKMPDSLLDEFGSFYSHLKFFDSSFAFKVFFMVLERYYISSFCPPVEKTDEDEFLGRFLKMLDVEDGPKHDRKLFKIKVGLTLENMGLDRDCVESDVIIKAMAKKMLLRKMKEVSDNAREEMQRRREEASRERLERIREKI